MREMDFTCEAYSLSFGLVLQVVTGVAHGVARSEQSGDINTRPEFNHFVISDSSIASLHIVRRMSANNNLRKGR